jgi:dipeptidase E
MEPFNPLLDLFILGQCKKDRPNVCFIPTASGDSQDYIDRFYRSMGQLNCTASHLSLFRGQTEDIEGFVMKQDTIYVGGGNTRNLITLWKDWGLDQILFKAYQHGIIMAGISAGSLCWFEQGVTDSIPGRLSSLNCLGILKGSNCPHYDGEPNRRPSYHQLMENNQIKPGLATEDGVAAHFVNEQFIECVSSHPDKQAYVVTLEKGKAVEQVIPAHYLGGIATIIRRASLRDCEAIHHVHMASIQQICSKDYSAEEVQAWGHRDYDPKQRAADIANDAVWVVELEGKIEGFGHLRITNQRGEAQGYLAGLYFTSKVTGHGFGKAIVEMMVEKLKNEKVKILQLESTLTAQSFYEKLGFQQKGGGCTSLVRGVPIRCLRMEKVI